MATDSEVLKRVALFGLALGCGILPIALIFGFPNITGIIATFGSFFVCIATYFVSGRRMVTPLSVFALASLFFLVIPYLYGISGVSYILGWEHNAAAIAVLFSTSITVFVSATFTRDLLIGAHYRNGIHMSRRACQKYFVLGVALVILGVAVSGVDNLLGRFDEALIFSAYSICLVVSVANLRRRNRRVALAFMLICVCAICAYFLVIFSGGGRLRIATLGFCSLIVISCFYRTYMLKVAPFVVAPVFLIWGSLIRTSATHHVALLTRLLEAKGMDSVLAPFVTLARLINELPSLVADPSIHYLWGMTYFYNILFWIPRAVWEDKPPAFGRAVVAWLRPDLLDTGMSMAVSYIGEAFANFYVFGILFSGFVAAFLIIVISRIVKVLTRRSRTLHGAVFGLAIYSVVGASIAGFVWADTNTFTQRALVRLVVLVVAFYMVRVKLSAGRRSC